MPASSFVQSVAKAHKAHQTRKVSHHKKAAAEPAAVQPQAQ